MKSNRDLIEIYEGQIWSDGWEQWEATKEGWKALDIEIILKYPENHIFIPKIEIEE